MAVSAWASCAPAARAAIKIGVESLFMSVSGKCGQKASSRCHTLFDGDALAHCQFGRGGVTALAYSADRLTAVPGLKANVMKFTEAALRRSGPPSRFLESPDPCHELDLPV